MTLSRSSQFGVLYRVFLLRVIDLEALSTDGSTAKLLGQFGAVFAGISFLFVLPLILTSGALAETDVWTMAHLLIATTFTAVGLSTILAWDSLVPERRDVLIVGPLPVRNRTLLFSKLAAVCALLSLVIGSLNVFTGLSWPFLFATHAGVLAAFRSLGAYWIAITLGGAFAAFLVIALQGITMQLLPRQVYLRLSAPLQALAFCAFTGLYFLEPSLESRRALTSQRTRRCFIGFRLTGFSGSSSGSTGRTLAHLRRWPSVHGLVWERWVLWHSVLCLPPTFARCPSWWSNRRFCRRDDGR